MTTSQVSSNNPPYIVEKELIEGLRPRKKDSHKGTYGRLGVVGGSRGMVGSIYMTALAALRTGSGLVYNMVPRDISHILEIKSLENIVIPIEKSGSSFSLESLEEILAHSEAMDVLALGPGLGDFKGRRDLIAGILSGFQGPLVLDADGLNALEGDLDLLARREGLVLTPHPMEFSRLTGLSIGSIEANREEISRDFAKKHNLTLLLKGWETIVTDGRTSYINRTGNPGMATAGSGDVLTGIIASLIGQGYDSFLAARLGAYIHGLAGDIAREEKGEYSLMARDLIEGLAGAFKFIGENRSS